MAVRRRRTTRRRTRRVSRRRRTTRRRRRVVRRRRKARRVSIRGSRAQVFNGTKTKVKTTGQTKVKSPHFLFATVLHFSFVGEIFNLFDNVMILWVWPHEEQAWQDCLQESQRCWKESLQEKRFGKMDQSFHASPKEPQTQGIRCMQEGNCILQGSHAPLQGISHVTILSRVFSHRQRLFKLH